MINGFKWLALIATVWIIRELIVSFWTWRKIQKLNHARRIECTRSQFAIARNSLMHLAINNQIDPNSTTFQVLYQVDTVFMRSPDKYPELGRTLREVMLTDRNEPNQEILAEKERWNNETRENIKATSDAMEKVITDYSTLYWIAFHVAKRPWIAQPVTLLLTKILRYLNRFLKERNPDIWEIKQAQRAMQDMATA